MCRKRIRILPQFPAWETERLTTSVRRLKNCQCLKTNSGSQRLAGPHIRHLQVGKRTVRKTAASVGEHQIGRQSFCYASTMSAFVLCTKATTSSYSAWGTLNAFNVASAWLRKIVQSLSLMRIPLWESACNRQPATTSSLFVSPSPIVNAHR